MKVFISGCYDMLHSGHVAFFKTAAQYGDLYVGIGSDETIQRLKGRPTINSETERLYMVRAIKYVKDAWINRGEGLLDFEAELKVLQPDRFVVNEDGHSTLKAQLCQTLGIEYIVLQREPDAKLPKRSTTALRQATPSQLPYRLDLAGTWIDQPYVSKFYPGWAITISLEPIMVYNERSGLSTSTRKAARELWPFQLPMGKPEKLAKLLFSYENRPPRTIISGAQDAIGICMPGICRHYYDNAYWPTQIETINVAPILEWLENHICLIPLEPRSPDLDLLKTTFITKENVKKLADAAAHCWQAILNRDLHQFAHYFSASFQAQTTMFPAMLNEKIETAISKYHSRALAWKLAGAGGGGYLALVIENLESERPKEAVPIKIRRRSD